MHEHTYTTCSVTFSYSETYHYAVHEWPRLQSSQEKPHWLRVDFDHWEDLSDDEEEEDEGGGGKKALARERLAEINEKQVK